MLFSTPVTSKADYIETAWTVDSNFDALIKSLKSLYKVSDKYFGDFYFCIKLKVDYNKWFITFVIFT